MVVARATPVVRDATPSHQETSLAKTSSRALAARRGVWYVALGVHPEPLRRLVRNGRDNFLRALAARHHDAAAEAAAPA